MFERVVFTLVLLGLGAAIYGLFRRYHIWRAASAFNDPILKDMKPGIPTIVYFTTPFCIPCLTQQKPALNHLEAELGERVQVIEINASEEPKAANRWGIFSTPTTFILDGRGRPQQVNHGVADAGKLRQQIRSVMAA